MTKPRAAHPENPQLSARADPTDSRLLEARPAHTFSMKYISGSLPRLGVPAEDHVCPVGFPGMHVGGGPGIWTSPGGGVHTMSTGRSPSPLPWPIPEQDPHSPSPSWSRCPILPAHPRAGPRSQPIREQDPAPPAHPRAGAPALPCPYPGAGPQLLHRP